MGDSPEITANSWFMVATLGIIWGGTFLITEIALIGMTPFWLAAGRIGFAACLMSLIWSVRGFRLFHGAVSKSTWIETALIGALSSALPFMLLAWGQQFVTAGFAGVSMAAVALFVLPMAHFMVPGERLSLRKGSGFIVGFCGVCVLMGAQAFETTGASMETAGRMACIGAAGCYATSSILMRRLPAVDAIGLSTVLIFIGAVMTLPIAFVVEGIPPLPDVKTMIVVAVLGLIPTAAANLLRVQVVRTAGPVFMSLTNYQVPIWSVILGAAVLNEPLPSSLLWAMGLILAGVALSQYGALKRMFEKD